MLKRKRSIPGRLLGASSSLPGCATGLLILSLLYWVPAKSGGRAVAVAAVDILHYRAQVEPDIAGKTVRGKVLIRFVDREGKHDQVEFDCGALAIDAVKEGGEAETFELHNGRLSVMLSRPMKEKEEREIEIEYHGAPRFGIRFFPEKEEVYTVFSTSQWMVCIDAPEDKATLELDLILPAGLSAVANGRLAAERALPNNKTVYEWQQETPVSTYTFGFAAGRFRALALRLEPRAPGGYPDRMGKRLIPPAPPGNGGMTLAF